MVFYFHLSLHLIYPSNCLRMSVYKNLPFAKPDLNNGPTYFFHLIKNKSVCSFFPNKAVFFLQPDPLKCPNSYQNSF